MADDVVMAGAGLGDAGTIAGTDGGGAGRDAGRRDTIPPASSGCGCRTSARSGASGAFGVLGALVWALGRRTRRA